MAAPGPWGSTEAASLQVPWPLQVMKTGSSLQIIMYRLHISWWCVEPACVTSVRSLESKSQVASRTCPGKKVMFDTGVKPCGSCGLCSHTRLWLPSFSILSMYTDLRAQ